MRIENLKLQLDNALATYHTKQFIDTDPIAIPHGFSKKQDIEIAAFLAATIAWGQRTSIINNATKLMQLMDMQPHEFVVNHSVADLQRFDGFVHRTFNAEDLRYFLYFLQQHYLVNNSLENAFMAKSGDMVDGLIQFNNYFFSLEHARRTQKHVATPARGSACKRLNLFLKWMVRKDEYGVDFGLWQNIKPSKLLIPLDVHVHKAALSLKLTQRHQADIKTVLEISNKLSQIDPEDPIKYDFALFGLGKFGV